MSNSRTTKSLKNILIIFFTQILTIILSFLSRSYFIFYLGNEFLSVNSLFGNILTILSFAELGIGSAVIYSLYKPIKLDDKDLINGLLSLYKRAFIIISSLIFFIGILILPFVNLVAKDTTLSSNRLRIIFFLFLLNSILSYFFSYKKALIIADQKEYIISYIQQITFVVQIILQIIIISKFKSFEVYLLLQCFFTLTTNYIISRKIEKLYPYLNSKISTQVPQKQLSEITNNIKSIFFYKLGSVVLSGTDSIIISVIINLKYVGLVSNYSLIIGSINSIVTRSLESLASSVGNLNADIDENKSYEVFNELYLIVFWIFSFCTICLFLLLNPFISIWIGEKYVLSSFTVLTLVSVFYFTGMNLIPSIYRTTLGYFNKVKYTPLLTSLFNITFSIFLGYLFGLSGVFIATSISRLLTFSIVDPYIVYKFRFKKSIKYFLYKFFKFNILFITTFILCKYLTDMINNTFFIDILKDLLVIFIFVNVTFYIFFRNDKEFKNIFSRIRSLIFRRT